MNRIKGMLLVLCLGASCANAAVITQTMTVDVHTPGGSENPNALTFNKFDTTQGTLESVQIIYKMYRYGGSVSVDNDSTGAQTATATISLQGGLSSSNGRLLNEDYENPWATVNSLISETYNLAATSGDAINQFDVTTGGDYAKYEGPSDDSPILLETSDYISSDRFSVYTSEGSGTYIIYETTTQTSSASGAGVQYAVTQQQTYSTVEVIYTYTPVPEPATASLACAGLLMLFRRRRQA